MKRLSFMQSVFRSMGLLPFLTTTTIFYPIDVLEITAYSEIYQNNFGQSIFLK